MKFDCVTSVNSTAPDTLLDRQITRWKEDKRKSFHQDLIVEEPLLIIVFLRIQVSGHR